MTYIESSDSLAGSSQCPEEGLRVHLEAAGVRVAEDASRAVITLRDLGGVRRAPS